MKQIEQTLTSIEVAEMVGKDHNMLLRDIRRYEIQLGQSKIAQSDFFKESTYQNSQNKEMPCYMVSKKGCEFIAHKLTGTKGTEFTAKYINKFHDMEDTLSKPMNPIQLMELQLQALKEVKADVESVNEDLQAFKEELPLLAIDCDKITTAVRAKGIEILGGKDSNAYADKSLRQKLYSDIHRELKRQFGLSTYKALKRNQCSIAISLVAAYQAPLVLQEEIKDINSQMKMQIGA